MCNPLGSLEADKGLHAPVLATINLCSDDLTPQLHTPRCVVPRLGALQDPLQGLLETAVWGSSPTAEVPTHEPTFVDPLKSILHANTPPRCDDLDHVFITRAHLKICVHTPIPTPESDYPQPHKKSRSLWTWVVRCFMGRLWVQ